MSRLRTKLVIAFVLVSTLAAPALAEPHSEAYREGQHALEKEAWGDASRIFGKLASESSDETDAALYWKAYADWKRKLKKESVGGLRQLLSAYPQSAWADDARALEI